MVGRSLDAAARGNERPQVKVMGFFPCFVASRHKRTCNLSHKQYYPLENLPNVFNVSRPSPLLHISYFRNLNAKRSVDINLATDEANFNILIHSQ